MVEQDAHNVLVAGSNPAGPTTPFGSLLKSGEIRQRARVLIGPKTEVLNQVQQRRHLIKQVIIDAGTYYLKR